MNRWGRRGKRAGSLVATGVDGADILEAKVPLQAGIHKGSHKAATSGVHVDLDIVPL